MLFKKKIFVSYMIFGKNGKQGYGNATIENFRFKTMDDIIDVQKKLVEKCKKEDDEEINDVKIISICYI